MDGSTVEAFIEAAKSQAEIATTISTAGIGAVILTWGCVLGLKDDVKINHFRWAWFLILPLVAFIAAVVGGYLLSSAVGGYHYEVLSQRNVTTNEPIKTDAVTYFKSEYMEFIGTAGSLQLISSLVGILSLSLWYAANVVYANTKGRPC